MSNQNKHNRYDLIAIITICSLIARTPYK